MEARDWTVPEGPIEWINIWAAFHDAVIERIESNLVERTIDLSICLGFPRPPLPHPHLIQVRIENVRFALVYVDRSWPGPRPEIPKTREESQAYAEAIQAKARVETVSITQLAESLKSGARSDVLEGSFAQDGQTVWLTLFSVGQGNADCWEIRVVGSDIQIQSEGGTPMTMEELLKVGSEAWDHWSKKSQNL